MATDVVSVDSRFLNLFTEICQLKGYKEALYDSQVRFHPKQVEEKQIWAEELFCFDDLLFKLCGSLQSNPQLSIGEARSCVLAWVTGIENTHGANSLRTLATRRVAERVMGLIIAAEKGVENHAAASAEPERVAA